MLSRFLYVVFFDLYLNCMHLDIARNSPNHILLSVSSLGLHTRFVRIIFQISRFLGGYSIQQIFGFSEMPEIYFSVTEIKILGAPIIHY